MTKRRKKDNNLVSETKDYALFMNWKHNIYVRNILSTFWATLFDVVTYPPVICSLGDADDKSGVSHHLKP